MKRWIVVLLVAAAVFVLILPGLVGRLAERDLAESVEQVSDNTPEITLSTESYDRGWFRSAGRHRLEFSDRSTFTGLARFVDEAGYENMPALVFDSDIHHGPLPLTAFGEEEVAIAGVVNLVSTVRLDPGNGKLVDLPGKVFTSIGLDGDARAVIDIDEGEWSEDDNTITWQGADLLLAADNSGVLTGVSGFVLPARFVAGTGGVESEKIEINFEQTASAFGLMVGSVHLQTGSVRSFSSFGPELGFTSADIRASNRLDDDELSGTSSVDIRGVGMPGLDDVGLKLDLVFDDLDAQSLAALITAWDEAADSVDPQQALTGLYPEYEQELQQLLAGGGEFRIDRLEISYPEGAVESDLLMSLPQTGAGDAFSWPGLLLKLEAAVNVRMPASVFDRLQTTYPEINSAVGMGFLTRSGDEYTMQIEYAKGLATVNGMPMPVPIPGS